MLRSWFVPALLIPAAISPAPVAAQIDARMLHEPAVSATHIAFVYAGDIWIVPKTGGVAMRVTSARGEEQFPRFSPDGSQLAFTADYDGNDDIYVMPALGGPVRRITHHPMPDRVLGWYPDGKSILFASPRESGRQRFNQLYRVAATGGLPVKLPVPYGEFGAVSLDGDYLAYMPMSQDFRTWKRYRGGWASQVWIYNLRTGAAHRVALGDANVGQPMWSGKLLYFLSDADAHQRANIWVYDPARDSSREVTHLSDYDIHFPSIGPADIVYEAGGRLYRLDLASEQSREVPVQVTTDEATLKPRLESAAEQIENAAISPSGKRALIEARGEVFSLPAADGPVVNLTNSSGVAERFPAWSPDGKTIAYWSDRSGEYELTLRNADGSGTEEKVTSFGPGFRYRPWWSPDSRKLAFVDQTMTIWIYDRDAKRATRVDKGLYMYEGQLEGFVPSWSADSRWLAYARDEDNRHHAIHLYDTKTGTGRQVTAGYYDDFQPTFDPEGKYLYFLTNRTFAPIYSDVENTWIYPNTTNVVAVPLRTDVASPLASKDDEEGTSAASDTGAKGGKRDTTARTPASVTIDVDGFEQRLVVLPAPAGNYDGLAAASGKLFYLRQPRTGADTAAHAALVMYDVKDRKEDTVLDNVDRFMVSANGQRVLVGQRRRLAIVDAKPGQKFDKPLRTAEMMTLVDPRAEWRQLFTDAWRFERDFFYDPNMHGVDWAAMRVQYGKLVDAAVTRWDVNFVIGELISELSSSHTYRGGGDVERPPQRGVGLLGADFSLENGAYRITRIINGAPWDNEVRSPLVEPGLRVRQGDYLLAVNGVPLDTAQDPWAAFDGLADKTVTLTVNSQPTLTGAHQVVVHTLAADDRLRTLGWIEANRRYVDSVSGGRVGYIYVPSTGTDGQTELERQFAAQYPKDGLIVDERWNSGGQIPDRFIELLHRPPLAWWAVRDSKDWQWPPFAHFGPEVMLINGWSGSGGDAFPFYFREAKLGPLVGQRTWGGLIGISGAPDLIDGGSVTVPTFRMYDPSGKWFAEGHGVDPDIEVPEDPSKLARGDDTQLDAAVQEALKEIQAREPLAPKRPPYERRVPGH